MSTSNNKWEGLKKWLVRYSKIVLPIILVVCVGLTIVIAVQANKRRIAQEESVVAPEVQEEGEETTLTVPDVPLEQDAVPGINELFETYYTAMVEGDTQTMERLVYYLDAQEILRAAGRGKIFSGCIMCAPTRTESFISTRTERKATTSCTI